MVDCLFPDLETGLLGNEAVDLLAGGGADHLFIEQQRRRLQFRQHQRAVERRVETALGVAHTPEGEATLKYWHPEAHRIRLQPANSSMSPIYVKEASVLGIVVGVVRNMR